MQDIDKKLMNDIEWLVFHLANLVGLIFLFNES
jgi:hypothetical protein